MYSVSKVWDVGSKEVARVVRCSTFCWQVEDGLVKLIDLGIDLGPPNTNIVEREEVVVEGSLI